MDLKAVDFRGLKTRICDALKAIISIYVMTQMAAIMLFLDVLLMLVLEPAFMLVKQNSSLILDEKRRMSTSHEKRPIIHCNAPTQEVKVIQAEAVRKMLSQMKYVEDPEKENSSKNLEIVLSEDARVEDTSCEMSFEKQFLRRVKRIEGDEEGENENSNDRFSTSKKKLVLKQRVHRRRTCTAHPRRRRC